MSGDPIGVNCTVKVSSLTKPVHSSGSTITSSLLSPLT